jgi:hypothetical protein
MILKLACKDNVNWYYEVESHLASYRVEISFSEFDSLYSKSDLKVLENFDFDEWRDNPKKVQKLIFVTFLDKNLKKIMIIADCDVYLLNKKGETIDIINRII